MADAAVTFLLENVTQLLVREVGSILGVGDEMALLKVELAQIRQFLRASKGKRDQVKEVVDEIRIMALKAEDVIDTFLVEMVMHKRRNMLDRYIRKVGHTYKLWSVAKCIKSIKNQIAAIYSSREKYGIVINDDLDDEETRRRENLQWRRRHVEEVEVVSFLEDAKIVTAMMTTSNLHLDVVSIVGLGGLGKTTLAKKIYNDTSDKRRFNYRAWVNVSEEFRPKDVLLQILQSLPQSDERIHKMSEDSLAEELRKYLLDKMYLIVLDDVWTPEVWTKIKGAFPDSENGSRILITSRIKELASHASTTAPYFLPLLNKDDSWELLSRKAFRGAACPPELESKGRQIAEKCKGLPLALVVVGGLLATREQSSLVWSQIVANVSWYLEKNPESFNDVLALSYQELPSHLKPCFLYLGVYPEDYEISARQLIRLWVAEGLIEQDTRRTPEDIADEYLLDLVDRSLVMVVERRSDRGIKSCMIHDLLRDLCIAEAAEDNFFVVHNENGFIKSSSSNRPRRISFPRGISMYNSSFNPSDTSLVRSLLWFNDDNEYQLSRLIFKDILLARVLQFDKYALLLHKIKPPTHDFQIMLYPGYKKLVLLRYVGMGEMINASIPSFVYKFPYLQTLDLREAVVGSFGDHFWNMQQLRHFFVRGPCELSPSHSPSRIKTMLNLQTLSGVGSDVVYTIDSKAAFPNVRKLRVVRSIGITSYRELSDSLWRDGVTKFFWSEEEEETRSKPKFENVQTLKIVDGSHFLSYAGVSLMPALLTKLTLLETRLVDAKFISLYLPNLEILKLMKNSISEPTGKLTNKSFCKLQVLHMVDLVVDRWWVDEECLSNLKYLVISRCRSLNMAPESLKDSPTLCHVKVSYSSVALENSFRELVAKNTCLVFEGNN